MPNVLLKRANAPVAVLEAPVVLLKSAPAPAAAFWSAVLARSVPAPMAVLNAPGVSLLSERKPIAVLKAPAGETQKRVLSFRCIASGITAVRWWAHCLGFGSNSQRQECECHEQRSHRCFHSVKLRENL